MALLKSTGSDYSDKHFDMLAYNNEVFSILERRFDERDLIGFYGGLFSTDGEKFVGYTYVALDAVKADEYSYLLHEGYSAIGADAERTKRYIDDNHYQYKNVVECIGEGIYNAFSIKFIGVYFEESWFVLKECQFWGDKVNEREAKELLGKLSNSPDFWNAGVLSDQVERDIETEVFAGVPWVVSHIKAEEKGKVKRTFSAYVNAAFVHPFFRGLRIHFFEAYSTFQPLFGDDYTLVFPDTKEYFLVVAMAKHRVDGYRLVWFFYDMNSRTFYRWTYPQPVFSEWSYHYAEEAINALKSISNWNNYDFFLSSRTMDDVGFWQEFVLKREGDNYLWLESLSS